MSGDSLQESVSDIWMSWKVSRDSVVNLVVRHLGILKMSGGSMENLFLTFGSPGGVRCRFQHLETSWGCW